VLDTIYSQIGAGIAILIVLFGFLKGDEPERIVSAAFALVILGGLAAPNLFQMNGTRWGMISLDILLLAVLCGLAWHSRRSWLIWAAAFQSLIVTGHLLVLLDIRPPGNAFAAVNNLSNYGLLIALAIGTFWAWQERRAAGLK
jgi:hydrogenase/urease accessory protein HupE